MNRETPQEREIQNSWLAVNSKHEGSRKRVPSGHSLSPGRQKAHVLLTWAECQEIVALRIKGKGSVFRPGALKPGRQEKFKGRRILAFGGIAFAGSPFIFAGIPGLRSPPGFQLSAPGGVQSDWGGGDHSP